MSSLFADRLIQLEDFLVSHLMVKPKNWSFAFLLGLIHAAGGPHDGPSPKQLGGAIWEPRQRDPGAWGRDKRQEGRGSWFGLMSLPLWWQSLVISVLWAILSRSIHQRTFRIVYTENDSSTKVPAFSVLSGLRQCILLAKLCIKTETSFSGQLWRNERHVVTKEKTPAQSSKHHDLPYVIVRPKHRKIWRPRSGCLQECHEGDFF